MIECDKNSSEILGDESNAKKWSTPAVTSNRSVQYYVYFLLIPIRKTLVCSPFVKTYID